MAHVSVGERIYLSDVDDFGYKTRTMLGIKNSAVCLSDTVKQRGYLGVTADTHIVNPVTQTNGLNEGVLVPTDFRTVGIEILDSKGISKLIQGTMFTNFVNNYTKEQRTQYVDSFNTLDKSNASNVDNFVNQMITTLS
jgi:hypothetical protein